MADRFLVWLGAEMVTAAVAAEMVAGAGVAVADSPPASDAKGTTSAESAKRAENKADSDTDSVGTPKPKPSDKKPKKDAPAEPKGPDETDAARRRPNRGDDGAARPAAGRRASGHQEVGADRIGNRGKGCEQTGDAGRNRAKARGDADGQARARRTKASGIQGRHEDDRQAVGPNPSPEQYGHRAQFHAAHRLRQRVRGARGLVNPGRRRRQPAVTAAAHLPSARLPGGWSVV